jgi:hypothetical protein
MPRRLNSNIEHKVKGNTKLYTELYRQVVTTAYMLEERLANEDVWRLHRNKLESSMVPQPRAVQVPSTCGKAAEHNSGDNTENPSDDSDDSGDDENSRDSSFATATHVNIPEQDHTSDQEQVRDQAQAEIFPSSLLLRASKYLYFRPQFVRQIADKLMNLVWNLHLEFSALAHGAQGTDGTVAELDDGLDAAENGYVGYEEDT